MEVKSEIGKVAITETKQDSFTLGTPAKGGAVKVYLNFDTETDEQLKEKVRRVIGLSKYAISLQ